MDIAAKIGGTDRIDLILMLYTGANNAKGLIIQGQNVVTGDANSAKTRIQGVLNVSLCLS
jgi:hypothetical protein